MYRTFESFRAAADAALLQRWGINFSDAGADEDEMTRFFHDHQRGETVQQLAEEYGQDFDFSEPDPWTAADLKRLHPIPPEDA